MEGLLMYLEPQSVGAILQTMQECTGPGSWLVFDYVKAAVIRQEMPGSDEAQLRATVAKAGEQWRYGSEPAQAASLMADHGFTLGDHKDPRALEEMYFRDGLDAW